MVDHTIRLAVCSFTPVPPCAVPRMPSTPNIYGFSLPPVNTVVVLGFAKLTYTVCAASHLVAVAAFPSHSPSVFNEPNSKLILPLVSCSI